MSTAANELLAKVAEAYAACRSYHDQGVVTTTFYSPAKRVQRRPFSTRFVRGTGFLFEFRSRRGDDDWDQYAVWNENGRIHTWWSLVPDRDEAESLALALAGATGVSGGSAYRVPHLLMPELHRDKVVEPRAATLLNVPEADASNCFVVEQTRGFGTEQVWIDRATFLIRRVVEPRHVLNSTLPPEAIEDMKKRHPGMARDFIQRMKSTPTEVEETTTYEAQFNPSIELHELVFVRPS